MPEAQPSSALPAPSLLIAVTGEPGSGKTRLLGEFAANQHARGQRVEGMLAIAGPRRAPHLGADEYWIRLLGTDQELSWAVRDSASNPPYHFEPETERKLQIWAERLSRDTPTPVLVLDEFSKFEVEGKGLMPLWPVLAASAPQIVIIAVRADLVGSIEGVIGRRFDLCLAAGTPGALEKLLRTCEDFGEWTRIGLFGGAAGGLEMTLGAALHAAKIPLRGLAMSSLQSGMMVFAGSGLEQPGRVVWVPFISGGLKALSPAGNRVRPMIAIVMQGLLFGASVQAFGWNIFALGLGGALVGAWAALQGFLLQYLMLGDELLRAYDTVVLWLADKWHVTAPGLPWLVGAWAVLHACVVSTITVTAWRLKRPPVALQSFLEKEKSVPLASAPMARAGWQRLREFGQWQFWLPLLVVTAILLVHGSSWESVAWLALRFVAVGCVLMALLSLLRPAQWAEQLRRRGWWGPAVAFSGALRRNGPAK